MARTVKYKVPGKLQAKQPAAKMVFDQYQRSRNEVVDPKREQWKEFYESYRNSMAIPEDNLVTRLAIPLVYSNVEDFLARLAVTPRIETWGRTPQDQKRASAHRILTEYDWQLLNMTLKMVRIAKTAEVYGTCFIKTTHRKLVERRLVRSTQEVTQELMGLPIGKSRRNNFDWQNVEVWNDPWIEVCEIDSVFPDPDGQTLDPSDAHQCDWVIHETPITLEELKGAKLDDEPLYDQAMVSKLADLSRNSNMKSGQGSAQRVTLRENALELFDDRTNTPSDPFKRQFTLLEYTSRDQIISVVKEAPGLDAIRNEGNPMGFINFMEFTPIPDLHSLYGIAMPEVLGSLQYELQTLHGAAIDNILQRVHQMFTVTRNSGINPNDIRFNPAGVVWVRNQGDIRPMPRESIDFSFARESQEIDRWAQKASSTDTFSGLSAGGGTATEASVLSEASGSKAGLMLTILTHQFLTPWGKQLMRTNELYMQDDRFGRIAGDEFSEDGFQRVSPEEIVSGSGMDIGLLIDLANPDPVNSAAKLQRAERFLQVLGTLGMPQSHPIMQATLLEYARGTKLSANPEQLIFGEQAQAAVQEQQALAQAEAQPNAPGQNADTQGQQIAADLGAQSPN